MDVEDFAQRWNHYATRVGLPGKFPIVVLPTADSRLSEATNHFLTHAGLPEGAGLRFDELESSLCRVYEVFGPTDMWNEDARAALENFLVIGSDQGGNPVCLDLKNHESVCLLDHEGHFKPYAFLNSSVAQLAECILIYQEMIETFQNEYGEDAELYEGNVPLSLVEQTLQRIEATDAAAIGANSYWQGVLEDI